MNHKERLKFVKDMTETALAHTAHPEPGEPQKLADGGNVSAQNIGAVAGGGAAGIPGAVVGGIAGNTGSLGNGGGLSFGDQGLAGGINDFLGTTDKFQAGSANIQAGTNQQQLNDAYTGAQSGLTQQQNLATAAQPGVAQGLGAQSALSGQLAARAAGTGPNPAQAALNQATGQNIQQQAALMAGQRGAAASPGLLAEAAARQGADTQQQAVGQSATLQAQQEVAAQQEQAGLSATQVNQGASAVQGVNNSQQNEQSILQGANTSANNAAVNMQSNVNNANAQTAIANQNAAQNTIGGILSGASSAIGGLFAHGGVVKMDKTGAVTDADARKKIPADAYALPGKRYPIHDEAHARHAMARISQNGTPAEKSKVKSAVQKKYPKLGAQKLAEGGEVAKPAPKPTGDTGKPPVTDSSPYDQTISNGIKNIKSAFGYADGGEVRHGYMKMLAAGGLATPVSLAPNSPSAPQSPIGQWLNSSQSPSTSGGPELLPIQQLGKPADYSKDLSPAKKAQSAVTGSAGALPGEDEDTFSQPLMAGGPQDDGPTDPNLLKSAQGGKIKAKDSSQKAVVGHDSYSNDKIPTELTEGEVVMDLDTLHDKGPIGQMARAVAKHIAQRNKK